MRNQYEVCGDTAWIRLGRHKAEPLFAMVDAADLPKLLAIDCRWIAQSAVTSPTFYAVALVGRKDEFRAKLYLHRVLTDPPPEMQVDHVNGNGLNDRQINLRVVPRSANQQNRLRTAKGKHQRAQGCPLI